MLSRRGLPGRVGMTLFVFVTMIISGGLIPTFFLIDRIGMTNTFWAMVIPFLVSPWNMLIMRNFFMALPESLEEAAIIDGATPLQTLVKIVLPLSTASIATIGLFYAVWYWNEWFYAPSASIATEPTSRRCDAPASHASLRAPGSGLP